MSLIVAERSVGSIALLELGNRFTADSIEELRDRMEKLELQGRQSLLFDCGRITQLDSYRRSVLVASVTPQVLALNVFSRSMRSTGREFRPP